MEHEVKVGRREATLVMSRRFPVRMSDIGSAIGSSFGEAYGYLGARGVEPEGPPFVIYHAMPHPVDPFEIEVCAPIVRATDPPAGWQIQELPSGTFATLVHVGPYDTLGAAYETLTRWVGEHELAMAGPPREVYFSPPETPPDQTRTIIEFPVSETAAPVPAR